MRRALIVCALAVVMVAANVASAFAWANGRPTADGFGTHDWLLAQAIQLAAADASWVDTQTALLATDDPDTWRSSFNFRSTAYREENSRHQYLPDSVYQGAPQAVTDHYARLVHALSAEDTQTASRELGIVSHYFTDVVNPFHTYSYGLGSMQDGIDHANYEHLIDRETTCTSSHGDWVTTMTPRPMTDVRARTIEIATVSRSKLLDLIVTNGDFSEYDPTTDIDTRLLLNRAVNDLADLIRSARSGSGQPRPIASIQTWSDYYLPALGRPARVWVNVKDDQGQTVEGVRVNFDYQVTQRCTYFRYTGADGTAGQKQGVVLGTLGVPIPVVVTAVSAGTTLTSSVTLVPTPIIGAGSSGMRSTITSDATPAQGTTVTVVTVVRDTAGKPMRSIKVVHTFKYRTRSVKSTTYTDAAGRAKISRNIGDEPAGNRVTVRADAYGGTQPQNTYSGIRTEKTHFVPHSGVASLKASRTTPAKPAQSSTVTVTARCLDDHGKAIVGRTVTFDWKCKTSTVHMSAKTDGTGVARVSRNIGKATVGFEVNVVASVRSGATLKRSVVSFTPIKR